MKFISARQAIYAAYTIHLGSTSSMEPMISGTKQNNIGKILNAFETGHITVIIHNIQQLKINICSGQWRLPNIRFMWSFMIVKP